MRQLIFPALCTIFLITACKDCDTKTTGPDTSQKFIPDDLIQGIYDSATFVSKALSGNVIDDSIAHEMIYEYIKREKPADQTDVLPTSMNKTVFIDFDRDAIQVFLGALRVAQQVSGRDMRGIRIYFANYGDSPKKPENKGKYTMVVVPTDENGKELTYLDPNRGKQVVIMPFNEGNLCPPPPPPCLDYAKQIILDPDYLKKRK